MTEEIEFEKQLFLIQHYDLENFLERTEPQIIKWKLISNILIEQFTKQQNQKLWMVIPFAGPLAATLKNIIRDTAHHLFQDITNQLENVEILSFEMAKKTYPETHNFSIGTYTLHPYDSKRLTRLEHYHKNLALEKDDELVILLGKMGAKTLRIVESDSKQKSGTGSVGVETIPVDAQESLELSQKTEKDKELLVTFEGNVVDIEPDLLRNSLWFANDSKLNAIFESRRFHSNRIEQYTLKNTYTETFDFNFDLAAKYLTVKVDLKAEYETISKKERLFFVEFGKNE